MRFALKFGYDGRNFYGYARQPKLKTVEEDLLKILFNNEFIKDLNQSNYKVASRTDKGVSALGNVFAFDTDFSKDVVFKELLGDFDDIIIYGLSCVDSDFYPRHAKYRVYRYYLKNTNLDFDKLVSIISCFAGKHNFNNFARVEEHKDPFRAIDNIFFDIDDDFFVIDFYAQTFLWHQIRRIISAVKKVSSGKNSKEDVIYALNNPNEKFDFGLACAKPLILKNVVYDFDFKYNKSYLNKIICLEKSIVDNL